MKITLFEKIPKKLFLLILISYLLLVIVGLTSEICLGDEVHHYRFAKLIYQGGKRLAEDPLYTSMGCWPKYPFISPPLWHILLVIFWKITGGISFYTAQIYQSIYYALLILFTYLLAKELYTQKEAWYSAIIIATCPMIVSFSILFYIDVPLAALVTICFYLIIKKIYFLAGLLVGLICATKLSGCFFIPAFIFLFFLNIFYDRVIKKIKNLFYFFLPALCVLIFNLGYFRDYKVLNYNALDSFKNIGGILIQRFIKSPLRVGEYLNSSLTKPIDIVKYFGFVLIISLITYFIYKKYQKKDIFLWITIVTYMAFYIYIFGLGSDVRYIMPIVPLLIILSSKSLAILNKKVLYLLFFMCVIQFGVTGLYVNINRRIPRGIKEGFNYIKQYLPEDAVILYPEENFIEGTQRRAVWANVYDREAFFWPPNDEEAIKQLKLNKVSYIAIKKSRIYDDSKAHHFGGYPKSFIERLQKNNLAQLVFNNTQIEIWKIK